MLPPGRVESGLLTAWSRAYRRWKNRGLKRELMLTDLSKSRDRARDERDAAHEERFERVVWPGQGNGFFWMCLRSSASTVSMSSCTEG